MMCPVLLILCQGSAVFWKFLYPVIQYLISVFEHITIFQLPSVFRDYIHPNLNLGNSGYVENLFVYYIS